MVIAFTYIATFIAVVYHLCGLLCIEFKHRIYLTNENFEGIKVIIVHCFVDAESTGELRC